MIDENETGLARLQRLADLGAMIEKMLPNSALFKHNDDTWTYRACVMDAVWDLPKRGYPVPSGHKCHKTPELAMEEVEAEMMAL